MSSYTIKSNRGEPIHIVSFDWSFELERDAQNVLAEIQELLEGVGEPNAVILDMRQLYVPLSDLFGTLGFSTRTGSNLSDHPMLAKLLLVTNNELLRLASSTLGHVQAVTNLELAVSYA